MNQNQFQKIIENAKAQSWGLVFDSKATSFEVFDQWVRSDKVGILGYLTGEKKELRREIKNYFPEFKTAIVFAFDYSKNKKILNDFYKSQESNGLKIASYVMGFEGEDYHNYLRSKLNEVSEELKKYYPQAIIKHSLDTQPILERDLAFKAGLGWFGKNSMLINREIGSFFILGSVFIDIDLSHLNSFKNKIETDHCGNCTRCIDACPTNAIDIKTRTIVANQCISTFSIEIFKEAPAPEGMEKSQGEIFGCDICQDVCPWNVKHLKNLEVSNIEEAHFFEKNKNIIETFLKNPIQEIKKFLESVSNREYRRIFSKTPLERTGRVGMLKNINFYNKE